jgi:hypothetical protein
MAVVFVITEYRTLGRIWTRIFDPLV